MSKLPLIPGIELCKILEKLGFKALRQRGSHVYFKHSDGRSTVVPIHPGQKIDRGLLRRIIKEIKMDRDDFLERL